MKKSLIVIISIFVIAACGTHIEKPQTTQQANQQMLANMAIKFSVIKAVEHAKDPKDVAAKARSVISEVQNALNDPSTSTLTLDAIDAKVKAIILQKVTDPADRLAFDTLREAVHTDLQARLAQLNLPVGQILTEQDIGAIKVILGDVEDGLTLAGY